MNNIILLKQELNNLNQEEIIMSKGQDTKKGSKKEPAKTMQEKKNAKRDKKNGMTNHGLLSTEKKK